MRSCDEHMLDVFRFLFQLRPGPEHQYYVQRLLPVVVSKYEHLRYYTDDAGADIPTELYHTTPPW